MQTYLAAHDDFVAWLDSMGDAPSPTEVDDRLWKLALTAAARGMGSTHWTFVIDGLATYAKRRHPANMLLVGYIHRGFDLCSRWRDVQMKAAGVPGNSP